MLDYRSFPAVSFKEAVSGDVRSGPHPNPCIDDAATLSGREREDWIEIELDDLVNLFHQARNAEEHLFKSGNVCGRMTAVALKQPVPADLADHLLGIAIRQWCDPETDVAEDLDVDPAEPERD